METKGIKVTNKKQFEAMVEWMERHPDFARGKGHFGSSKQEFKNQKQELSEILNSYVPPTANASDWHRVWINFKSNVKKKLSNNRQNSKATGGGVSMAMVLSPLEETVANLTHAPLLVNPPGVALGMTEDFEDCVESNKENVPEELPFTSRYTIQESVNRKKSGKVQLKPMKRPNILDVRIKSIKKHCNNQEKMMKTINRMKNTLYKMYGTKEKTVQFKFCIPAIKN